ncbi:hypothetical protein F4810DRAFT_685999 [Camillea tinctor]|nr:hypothetical protein F4810DRAFT_685999 [Camillea tinctor]
MHRYIYAQIVCLPILSHSTSPAPFTSFSAVAINQFHIFIHAHICYTIPRHMNITLSYPPRLVTNRCYINGRIARRRVREKKMKTQNREERTPWYSSHDQASTPPLRPPLNTLPCHAMPSWELRAE